MVSSKGKRMRSVVTLEVKLKIIKELEEEKSQKLVAEQFKVAKLTISDTKQKHLGCKKGEANQKQQLSDYRCIRT